MVKNVSSYAPCLPCLPCYLAGLTAPRQTVALESHFDHHPNALVSALRESADPMMYVTQLPEASTHPKYMSLKDETRGSADSIRAVNCLKMWVILYRWEKRIKLKDSAISYNSQRTFLARTGV